MKQVFEKYLGRDELLEVYTRDSDNFDVGRVLGLDDNYVLLHALSKYGRDEGLVLCALESITSVQADTRYLEKTKILRDCDSFKRQLPEVRGDDMLDFLIAHASMMGLGVSFELKGGNPEDYCGAIRTYDDEIITLLQVGLYGDIDGFAYLRRDEIERMDCDDQAMRSRMLMWQRNLVY